MIHFSKIDPQDAMGLVLPMQGVQGPINELGDPCPWPWDPIQLKGAPIGMYHCPYCLSMVMAGMDHLDYAGFDEHYAEYCRQQEANHGD